MNLTAVVFIVQLDETMNAEVYDPVEDKVDQLMRVRDVRRTSGNLFFFVHDVLFTMFARTCDAGRQPVKEREGWPRHVNINQRRVRLFVSCRVVHIPCCLVPF